MATCKVCNEPLFLTIDPEDSGDEAQTTVPDDLVLPCGCHFHWACLMDHASQIISTNNPTCPSCNTHILLLPPSSMSSPSLKGTIPVQYTNEGGPQQNLDIVPLLEEESLLSQHPEARPARALHTMVSEGDTSGILALLGDIDSDAEIDISAGKLLVWRDPLNGLKSALHVAIEAGQEEVFWMLLWLGSTAPTGGFPQVVVQEAQAMGLSRREWGVPREEDVRFVEDENERTPGDYCAQRGEPWSLLCQGGLFD